MCTITDIRAIFDAKQADRLSSDDLVAFLIGLDDRPWPELSKGKPLTKAKLAHLLRPLAIFSGSIRLDDGRTPKGYYRHAFDDAFSRYLPSTLEKSATTTQASVSAASSDFQNTTNGNGVAFQNRENPSVSAGCGIVADKNTPEGGDGDARLQEPLRQGRILATYIFDLPAAREPGEDDGAAPVDAPL